MSASEASRDVPRIRPGVELQRPVAPGAPWIVQRVAAPPLRLGEDVGAFLEHVDGRTPMADMARLLGEPWGAADVAGLVDVLRSSGVLLGADEAEVAPPRERRWRFIPPATLQLRGPRAAPLTGVLASWTHRAPDPLVLIAAVVIALAGAVALALSVPDIVRIATTPLRVEQVLLLWAGLVAVTVVHEVAHGTALSRYGGTPGRFGVMLFYATPAAFCEVTDGWRLPRRGQRVVVALAGIGAQTVIGAVAALVGVAVGPGGIRDSLLIFAAANVVGAVVNTIPFVKLDGYIALIAWLDRPNLRRDAMRLARARALSTVLGARRPPDGRGPRWMVVFGVLSAAVPVVLLGGVALRAVTLLAPLGLVGAAMVWALWLYLLSVLLTAVWRAVRDARRSGAPLWRIAVAVTAAVATCVAIGLVPVPGTQRTGFVRTAQGVSVVLPPGVDAASLCGRRVELGTSGLVGSTALSSGRFSTCTARDAEVPISALLPIDLDMPVERQVVDVDVRDHAQVPEHGQASIRAERTVLAARIEESLFSPLWTFLERNDE